MIKHKPHLSRKEMFWYTDFCPITFLGKGYLAFNGCNYIFKMGMRNGLEYLESVV